MKDLDFILKNLDFILKNLDLCINRRAERGECAGAAGRDTVNVPFKMMNFPFKIVSFLV